MPSLPRRLVPRVALVPVALILPLIWMGCATPTAPEPDRVANKPAHASAPSRAPEPAPEPSPPADPFATGFVEAHNDARAQVSPPAKPALPPVQWSDELAATATAHAQRCEFEHSNNEFGENLSARTDMAPPKAVVEGWAAEAQDYDYTRNRCNPGAVCGHYTQVVWRDSTTIGCGVAQCSGASGGPFGGREWFMWVCNYSPAGNLNRQRPY